MPRAHLRAAGAAILAVVVAASPATAAPRQAGLRPAPSSPEAGLWDLSDKAEQHVRHSAELNSDPALNAYVREVACKVAAEYCEGLRVYVLDRPFFNASMAPNGYTEVWSGLLLRCEDEAELAFVLGHETTHFAESHGIEAHEAMKARANAALVVSVGIAIAGAAAAAGAATPQSAQSIMNATGDLVDVVYLAQVAAFFRFSREQEAEADQLGLRRAVNAGYRATAAADSWRGLMTETAASDFEKIRKQDARLGIFDSHPLTATRVSALEAQAKTFKPGGEAGAARYRAAIRPFLGRWLKDDLRRRDFGETLQVIDRLARSGEDLGVLNFYRGESYRLRGKPGDVALARDAYAAATGQPDAPPAAWRELGEMRRRGGDAANARAALEAYLRVAPEADDAWMVRETLEALAKAG